jgi:hypothetical protein
MIEGYSGLQPNEKKPENEFKVEAVETEEAIKVLNNTFIHSDPYNGRELTVAILEKEGLVPTHKVSLENGTVCLFSDIYKSLNGRVAVVAYVKDGKNYVARTYYLSNSHGVWRYLPSYRGGVDGKKINWFNKGYGEESITLPIAFQKALADMRSSRETKVVSEPEFVFAGTARNISNSYLETYRLEVDLAPRHLQGPFYGDKKSDPGNLDITSKQAPDFTKVVTSWREHSSLYGDIDIEVFGSQDGELNYMFCKDKNNRAWIGGIETNTPIQSTGLHKSWVDGGDMSTPAYEYMTMVGDSKYANYEMENGHYVDMFKNYLSWSPLIQRYLARFKNTDWSISEDVPDMLYFNQKTGSFDTLAHESMGGDSRGENNWTRMYFDQRKNQFVKPTLLEAEVDSIAKADSFEELFDVLDKIPNGYLGEAPIMFSVPVIKEVIRSILNGSLDASILTERYGLRAKVLELIGKEIK